MTIEDAKAIESSRVEQVRRSRRVLPGFGLSLGITITYLSILVIIPLSTIFVMGASTDPAQFWQSVSSPRVLAALRLTLGISFAAALINLIVGPFVAWTLVRYRFPGKAVFDALVDLPFALPTAVAGIALTSLYAPQGWIGKILTTWGVKVAFTPLGILIALTFIGLPFVIRTVQPVIEDLEPEIEEAAAVLGANRFTTILRVVLPSLWPSLFTGFALAFARALGEYGSVVFIAGNMPMKTEITSLLIIIRLEQFDYRGAAALALVMLLISFFLMFVINALQYWQRRLQFS